MHTVTGDQANASVLRRWRTEMSAAARESGGASGFDAVIDDGGHKNSQLAATFLAFWPEVRPGGVYFLEDLHVGYSSRYEDTRGQAIMADVLQGWLAQLAGRAPPSDGGGGGPFAALRRLPAGVEFVACQPRACAVGKRRSRA